MFLIYLVIGALQMFFDDDDDDDDVNKLHVSYIYLTLFSVFLCATSFWRIKDLSIAPKPPEPPLKQRTKWLYILNQLADRLLGRLVRNVKELE